jgi:Ca2+-binding RTX toxin-like protein
VSEPRRRLFALVVGIAMVLATVTLVLGPRGRTYAELSDSTGVGGNSATADVWAPVPPAVCGAMPRHVEFVYGTPGDDVIHAGNGSQVIMGLGGADVVYGGNGKDCLIGGAGDDRLFGGNGKTVIDGGDGVDFCESGNAPTTIVNCEDGARPHAGGG